MNPSDFFTFRNIGLPDSATSNRTSTVGEPSIANRGKHIFISGNWYASASANNGNTWQYVDPSNTLPSAAGGFCCDQIVHYDPSRDITIWLLQYRRANNTNVLRLAINRGPAVGGGGWYWWDFTPVGVNSEWDGEWFDYPDLALTNNHLYMTTNVFRITGGWTRAVIFKFPLDTLAAGTSLGYSYYSTTANGSLRCAQGARETMYFASHNSSSSVRIFTWPDNNNSISWNDVAVAAWTRNYATNGPDGRNWLKRVDPRITGGWVADGVIGFMWTAGRNASRPFPHARVIRVDENTKALIDQPDIWSNNAAYAYPAVCPNDRGHLGLSIFYGGGKKHPSYVVGVNDDYTGPTSFALFYASQGTDGPISLKWGDYITCRRHSPDGFTWIGTGFTLQGGGNRTDIVPRMIHFGRRRDRRGVEVWADGP